MKKEDDKQKNREGLTGVIVPWGVLMFVKSFVIWINLAMGSNVWTFLDLVLFQLLPFVILAAIVYQILKTSRIFTIYYIISFIIILTGEIGLYIVMVSKG
ncbi:MAG: hypothetical protein GY861_09190 [bacterium]|nr:hypothetical protein [bacterium]